MWVKRPIKTQNDEVSECGQCYPRFEESVGAQGIPAAFDPPSPVVRTRGKAEEERGQCRRSRMGGIAKQEPQLLHPEHFIDQPCHSGKKEATVNQAPCIQDSGIGQSLVDSFTSFTG